MTEDNSPPTETDRNIEDKIMALLTKSVQPMSDNGLAVALDVPKSEVEAALQSLLDQNEIMETNAGPTTPADWQNYTNNSLPISTQEAVRQVESVVHPEYTEVEATATGLVCIQLVGGSTELTDNEMKALHRRGYVVDHVEMEANEVFVRSVGGAVPHE